MGPQFVNAGGVYVAYPEFQNSAFPYRGPIPASAENPAGARPFLNVNDNGRLGHESPRGGVYWEDATYSDRHVLVAAPQNFDSGNPGDLVVFFHGNSATLARDVVDRQQAPRQLAKSGLNGVLIAPQLAVDALELKRWTFLAARRARGLPRRGGGEALRALSQRAAERIPPHARHPRRL